MKMREVYELSPLPGQQRSFYGKARVEVGEDGSRTLISYWTPVARIDSDGFVWRLWNGWSSTTGRHIKAFCGLNKDEFFDLPYDDLR